MTVFSQSASGSRPAIAIGRSMFSLAVSIGSRLKNWKTKPMLSRRSRVSASSLSVVISVPSTVTEPSLGLSSPARMCMSVDLPEPDGPITAVSLPRSISTDTSRSAVTAVSPSPYRRLTPDAVTTGPVRSASRSCACCMASTIAALLRLLAVRQVIMLRGINLGPNRRVPMADLRAPVRRRRATATCAPTCRAATSC